MDHPPPSSAEVKKVTPIPLPSLCALMICYRSDFFSLLFSEEAKEGKVAHINAIMAYMESTDIAPLIFNVGPRWR